MKRECPACKGYCKVAPESNPEAPASEYVLCRRCGGAGRIRGKNDPPEYAVSFVELSDGRLVLIGHDEESARPWVNALQAAGLTLEHLGAAGRYAFRFAERPELQASKTPAELRPFYWLDDRPGQAEG